MAKVLTVKKQKAFKMNEGVPEEFLQDLTSVGKSTFKGSQTSFSKTLNEVFDKDHEYDVYNNEGIYFVIGSDNQPYKMTLSEWLWNFIE